MKGYRSDFDLLIIVNNRKLCDFAEYWHKAADRLIQRQVDRNTGELYRPFQARSYLKEGQYFFSDIRKEGIVLYELDNEPLAEPMPLSPGDRLRLANEHFHDRLSLSHSFLKIATSCVSQRDFRSGIPTPSGVRAGLFRVLLTLTNYGPPSHNIKFLRSLAEEQDRRLAEAFPRDQYRERAWFDTLNEAYVKARYSKHFEISEEGVSWLAEKTSLLLELANVVCSEHLARLKGNGG